MTRNKFILEHMKESRIDGEKAVLCELLGFGTQENFLVGLKHARGGFDLRKLCGDRGNDKTFGSGPLFLSVVTGGLKLNAADLIVIWKVLVVVEFIANEKQNENTHRKSQRESEEVDDRIGFVFHQVTPS